MRLPFAGALDGAAVVDTRRLEPFRHAHDCCGCFQLERSGRVGFAAPGKRRLVTAHRRWSRRSGWSPSGAGRSDQRPRSSRRTRTACDCKPELESHYAGCPVIGGTTQRMSVGARSALNLRPSPKRAACRARPGMARGPPSLGEDRAERAMRSWERLRVSFKGISKAAIGTTTYPRAWHKRAST
jgi:hypothetical protein